MQQENIWGCPGNISIHNPNISWSFFRDRDVWQSLYSKNPGQFSSFLAQTIPGTQSSLSIQRSEFDHWQLSLLVVSNQTHTGQVPISASEERKESVCCFS